MGELRAAQQEHRRAKAAQQEAERSWQSERRALKDQYTVNVSHTAFMCFFGDWKSVVICGHTSRHQSQYSRVWRAGCCVQFFFGV